MKNIAVIGLGKVGSLVGALLNGSFNVEGVDQRTNADDHTFKVVNGNVNDSTFLDTFLASKDAVVSCLPYNLNLPVALAAYKAGIHYFDLTEDVATTGAIRKMAY